MADLAGLIERVGKLTGADREVDAAVHRLTAKRRKNLQWIADHEPVGWFDTSGPTDRQVKNFAKDGLVERVPDDRPFHLIRWRLTESGRRALGERE